MVADFAKHTCSSDRKQGVIQGATSERTDSEQLHQTQAP